MRWLLCLGLAACSSASVGPVAPDLSTGDASHGVTDGTPTRQQCTSHYGSALTSEHGRLDGLLTTVLAPGEGKQCNGDDTHVHLQVSANGAVYDVAVDIGQAGDEVASRTVNAALPDGAWSEGWHPGFTLSYPSLGVASSSFTLESPSDAAKTVENALAQANHVSIFGTGYDTNGMHLVHYESGSDGAIVTEPLAPSANLLLLRFQNDTF